MWLVPVIWTWSWVIALMCLRALRTSSSALLSSNPRAGVPYVMEAHTVAFQSLSR